MLLSDITRFERHEIIPSGRVNEASTINRESSDSLTAWFIVTVQVRVTVDPAAIVPVTESLESVTVGDGTTFFKKVNHHLLH